MRKILVILCSLLLCFSMTSFSNVKADVTEISVDDVKAYIPDEVFAKAVQEAIMEDFDNVEDKSSVEKILETFKGSITFTKTSSTIRSIEGIQYLRNASIYLVNQSFHDASWLGYTIGNNTKRGSAPKIDGTPVNVWPKVWLDTEIQQTYAIPTVFIVNGSSEYLYGYGSDTKTINMNYDVYTRDQNGTKRSALIDTTNADVCLYSVGGVGMSTVKAAPEATDTLASFKAVGTKQSSAQAKILVDTNRYVSMNTPNQQVTPRYEYNWTVKWWNKVNIVTKLGNVTTSVKFAKFSADDELYQNPVPGAVYALYKAGNPDQYIQDVITEEDYVVIPDLVPGNYYFVEKEAPKGYDKVEEHIDFVVSAPSVSAPTAKLYGYNGKIYIDADTINATPDWDSGNKNKINNMTFQANAKTEIDAAADPACVYIQNNNRSTHLAEIDIFTDGYEMTGTTYKFNNKTYEHQSDVVTAVNELIDNGTVEGNLTIEVIVDGSAKETADSQFVMLTAVDPKHVDEADPDTGIDTTLVLMSSISSAAALAFVLRKKHNN